MATYFAGDFNSLRIFVFTFSLFARRDWATIVTTMEAATERANAGFSVENYHYHSQASASLSSYHYNHQGQCSMSLTNFRMNVIFSEREEEILKVPFIKNILDLLLHNFT